MSLNTNKGSIVVALDKTKAPISAANFLGYTNTQFYDSTIFHRVIDGFMIQGGGVDINYQVKSTNAPITNEANNGLLNTRGTIAAARTSEPHSATSGFFINSVDNAFLNYQSQTTNGWGYAVFGHVISGMNVVDTISNITTGAAGPFTQDVPTEKIIIETALEVTCTGL